MLGTVAGSAQTRSHMPQVIQTFSAGLDQTIPVVPVGVMLCSARGAHDTTVSEWVVAVLLSSFRQLHHFYTRQLESKWESATLDIVNQKTPSVGRLQQVQVQIDFREAHSMICRLL